MELLQYAGIAWSVIRKWSHFQLFGAKKVGLWLHISGLPSAFWFCCPYYPFKQCGAKHVAFIPIKEWSHYSCQEGENEREDSGKGMDRCNHRVGLCFPTPKPASQCPQLCPCFLANNGNCVCDWAVRYEQLTTSTLRFFSCMWSCTMNMSWFDPLTRFKKSSDPNCW